VAEVLYPDCTNYEGRKILVLYGNKAALLSTTHLDPHFCDGPHDLKVFARFEPTEDGWDAACATAARLKYDELQLKFP
jgi:hypothetical protein